MQSTAQLQTLIASAEREMREARKSTDDGLYAILCALGVMKLKNEIKQEGEWQWVPKGFVVAPEEPNLDMLVFGERAEPIARNIYPSKIYKAMIAARPPVPKKGERA